MAIRTSSNWLLSVVVAAGAGVATAAHAQSSPVAETAAAPAESGDSMVDSPMFKIGWPKIEMPKFSWKNPMSGSDNPSGDGSNP
ncbi:MAG: hypothetical protein AAF805_13505, partial [Planctomycetota bacterium]